MHKITKEFGLDYGHRVWSQKLNPTFSIDDCLVCRHLHGHRMALFIELEAEKLEAGMVTDFKHLNWFKEWLDIFIDHKFIIDINDPAFERITGRTVDQVNFRPSLPGIDWANLGHFILDGSQDEITQIENEITESFVVVEFVPTSENLAKWFFEIVTQKMVELNVKVSKVTMSETPKSQAVYYA